MWLISQEDTPDDYVIATGETDSVREFVGSAFAEIGVVIEWQGSGVEEKGVISSITKMHGTELSISIGDIIEKLIEIFQAD